MELFALNVVGVLGLLLIASLMYFVSARIRLPFTITLFMVGIGLHVLTNMFPELIEFFGVQFSPEIVFYIFLPTLLFESAYKISYRRLVSEAAPIAMLAIGGLLLSAFLIAGFGTLVLGYVLHFSVPFLALLIFGAIISATDPVAVLAIFKDFGVPKRLEMLFDGESVFNDGTALALFLVVLEIARSGVLNGASLFTGVLTFLAMLFLGILYGALTGTVTAKVIGYIRNNHAVEITLMMALAHLTFISAELISHAVAAHGGMFAWLQISPVIATAIAAVTLGNYGRYKISPPVFKAMDLYWGYFAFICNSLIFLLMGYVIGTLEVTWSELWLPTLVVVLIVMVARAISVYCSVLPFNLCSLRKIPLVWQHLLAYGSLRGGLAVAMIMLLPTDLTISGWTLTTSPSELIKAFVIGCITFSLVVKATTFGSLMRYFKVGDYSAEEAFTDRELRSYMDKAIIDELAKQTQEKFLLPHTYHQLTQKYQELSAQAHAELVSIMGTADFREHVTDIVARYALGIEQYAVEDLFARGEVTERVVRIIAHQIEGQHARLESGEPQIRPTERTPWIRRIVKLIDEKFLTTHDQRLSDQYLYHLAREKMCLVVEQDLRQLFHSLGDESGLKQAFSEVQLRYTAWHANAATKRKTLLLAHQEFFATLDLALGERIAGATARRTLAELHEHEIVPEKVHSELSKIW